MTKQPKTPMVNYIRHLDLFYEFVQMSNAIHYAHISLYLALFRAWNQSYFTNPLTPHRELVMTLAGIKSKECYYRLLRELSNLDLIRYYPAKSRYVPGTFTVSTFDAMNDYLVISVWAVSSFTSITGKKIERTFDNDSKHKGQSQPHKSKLINGSGQLIIEKTVEINFESAATSERETNLYDDPRFQTSFFNNLSSLQNSSKYGNGKSSSSRSTNLNPSGIPIDPNADYSVPL